MGAPDFLQFSWVVLHGSRPAIPTHLRQRASRSHSAAACPAPCLPAVSRTEQQILRLACRIPPFPPAPATLPSVSENPAGQPIRPTPKLRGETPGASNPRNEDHRKVLRASANIVFPACPPAS